MGYFETTNTDKIATWRARVQEKRAMLTLYNVLLEAQEKVQGSLIDSVELEEAIETALCLLQKIEQKRMQVWEEKIDE